MDDKGFSFKINDDYVLKPLLEVQKDNIETLFEDKIGVYICNYQEELWYKKNQFEQKTNYSIEKKISLF